MSSSIINGLLTGEEARINKLKPMTGTSVSIEDADGTERIKVDGANTGIGTDSPERTLHITKDAAADPSYAANQPLIIEDDNRPGIQLVGSANNIGIIEFGDNAHPNAGSINFDHSTDRLRFGFGDDAEKVYIDSSGNMVIDGDLTVNGDTTTLSTTNSVVEDKLIELGNGVTGTPSGDAGIIIERGSSANAAIVWDESRDEFVLGTTSATGASTGDLTVTPGNVSVERIGAGAVQAEAEVHAKRDASSSGQYSTTAPIIIEDDARPAIQLVGSANNIGMIQFGDNSAEASGQIYYDHSTDKLRVDCGGSGDRMTVDSSGNVVAEGSVILKEKAAAIADTAAYGQLWTKTATPNQLYFTTDAGDDIQLTSGTAIVSSGSGDVVAGSTFTTANIIMVCDGDDKTIDEPSGTISTNDQALTVGSNTGIRVGDGSELELSVEAGNDVVIRSHGSNNDVHFKVNDGGTNTTVMVLDGGDPAVHIKGGAASAGVLKIFEDSDDGTDAVTITVPALAAAYTLTLPADDGDSGEYLQTNGSGTLSWAAATGTDRMTTTNRFRAGAFSATASTYFTGDVATDAGQWYLGSWSATHGSTIDVDADWLSGYEVGPQWQAPRACTLTQIAATSRINNSAATAVRIHVFKATPVNNTTSSDPITMTLIGSADLDDGSGSPGVLTDYELQTVNDTISSGNSVSAGDVIVIGMQPITGATSATSYFQVTLEFTVS